MTNFFISNFSISTIMSSRKYPSGSEKRKKSKQSDAFIQTQRGALDINIWGNIYRLFDINIFYTI